MLIVVPVLNRLWKRPFRVSHGPHTQEVHWGAKVDKGFHKIRNANPQGRDIEEIHITIRVLNFGAVDHFVSLQKPVATATG